MKPRFNLSFYPLKGRCLYLAWTATVFGDARANGSRPVDGSVYTITLDAEETAAFWKY